MAEGTNGNERRFQEISSLLEQLINSQKHLLQAQVILSDRDRSEQLLAKLLEHQEITGRNLSLNGQPLGACDFGSGTRRRAEAYR